MLADLANLTIWVTNEAHTTHLQASNLSLHEWTDQLYKTLYEYNDTIREAALKNGEVLISENNNMLDLPVGDGQLEALHAMLDVLRDAINTEFANASPGDQDWLGAMSNYVDKQSNYFLKMMRE